MLGIYKKVSNILERLERVERESEKTDALLFGRRLGYGERSRASLSRDVQDMENELSYQGKLVQGLTEKLATLEQSLGIEYVPAARVVEEAHYVEVGE